MNRRRALALFARAPIVGAIAGKQIADEAVGKLISGGHSGLLSGLGASGVTQPAGTSKIALSHTHYQAALRLPAVRSVIEAMLYEESRTVHAIDPDIAVMRSFSLAAKVAYQRQRNVARRLQDMQNPYPWQRITAIVARALGLTV